MTTICFDFGNTRLKAAIFQEASMVEEIFLQDDSPTTLRTLLGAFSPQKSILSSVIAVSYTHLDVYKRQGNTA